MYLIPVKGGQPWSGLEQVLLTHTNVLPRIYQSEWGYSLTDGIINGSALRQAQFLARTLLLGLGAP